MKIHEYQGKQIFAKYGVPVPKGLPAFTVDEAEAAAKRLIAETGSNVVVVKAQIHAGGRGKGGGVKVAKGGAAEAREIAQKMLGMQLITHQTGPEGTKVQRLYVEQGLEMVRELYLGAVVDRDKRRIAFMASTEGGVEIEKVAAETPEKILTVHVDPTVGLSAYQSRQLAFGLGMMQHGKETVAKFVKLMSALYTAFVAEDCSLLEINPLVVLKNGDVVALDSKINFDDNADFRHRVWEELRDKAEEDPVELEAKQAGLNYVSLDGNVGCLVNGAGLAMATMDIIKHAGEKHGVSPANFLDVGGGATQEQVTKAFSMILRSPKVKAIFVNIFGGIMKCDVIAAGVINATRKLGLKVPLVVRLEGTNVNEGRRMLEESGLAITPAQWPTSGVLDWLDILHHVPDIADADAALRHHSKQPSIGKALATIGGPKDSEDLSFRLDEEHQFVVVHFQTTTQQVYGITVCFIPDGNPGRLYHTHFSVRKITLHPDGSFSIQFEKPTPPKPAAAAAPPVGKQAPGFYRTKLGDFEVTVVQDGVVKVPKPENLVVNRPFDEVGKALDAAFIPRDNVWAPFTPVVINTGKNLVLIDTGFGDNGPPTTGNLLSNLAASGIDPKTIDTVVPAGQAVDTVMPPGVLWADFLTIHFVPFAFSTSGNVSVAVVAPPDNCSSAPCSIFDPLF